MISLFIKVIFYHQNMNFKNYLNVFLITIISLKETKFESIVGLMVEFQLAKLGVRVRFPDDAFLPFNPLENCQ